VSALGFELDQFVPLRDESIDTIRARIDAGVNAGLDPGDPRWQDTTPGGFFWDHTQAAALEAELLWDMASMELPASFFLPFSWGTYLDYWGEILTVDRKDAAFASGALTFTNPSATLPVTVSTGVEVAAPTSDPEADPLVFETTEAATLAPSASATLAVQAAEPGSEYNVAANAVTLVLSSVAVNAVNADAMSGGADVETDEAYKRRLLLEFSAARGGGTEDDYIAETLALPGVGFVVVQRLWAGAGTVRLVVTDTENNPMSAAAVASIQSYWDGAAPIGHIVTVATVAALAVAVSATIVFNAGFSLDGAGGTEAARQAIVDAIGGYINGLLPGEDVVLNRVIAAIVALPAVYNVTALTLNGSAADVVVGPLQVAQVSGAPTLT
jgi:uncharacterized phage protein gp47/JayE